MHSKSSDIIFRRSVLRRRSVLHRPTARRNCEADVPLVGERPTVDRRIAYIFVINYAAVDRLNPTYFVISERISWRRILHAGDWLVVSSREENLDPQEEVFLHQPSPSRPKWYPASRGEIAWGVGHVEYDFRLARGNFYIGFQML